MINIVLIGRFHCRAVRGLERKAYDDLGLGKFSETATALLGGTYYIVCRLISKERSGCRSRTARSREANHIGASRPKSCRESRRDALFKLNNSSIHHPTVNMIIPINLSPSPNPSDSPTNTFPPQLAQLGTSELVILEMQGSFHVEGAGSGSDSETATEARGKLIAKLRVDGVRRVDSFFSLPR